MATTNLLKAIAKNIRFPNNVEWSDDYAETIDLIVEVYTKASKSDRNTFKDDLQSFLEVYDIFHGSDDDTDYIQPYYCYIKDLDLIKALGPVPGAGASIARREAIKRVFTKETSSHDLTNLKMFEDINEAWTDVSAAAIAAGMKKAYFDGKINLQWKEIVDSMKLTAAITWEALDFAIDVLEAIRG